MKRTLKKYNKGGKVLPKFSGTDVPFSKTGAGVGLGIAASSIPMMTSFIPKNNYKDSRGNDLGSVNSIGEDVLNGASMGASIDVATGGATLGIPTALGAIGGGIKNWLGNEDMQRTINQRKTQIHNQDMNEAMYTNKNQYFNQSYNNDNMIFADGGMININSDVPNATEEVEGGESAITPEGDNIQFNGPTHEEGGIETNLPEGTFIFSDRLKMGKRTFASLAKPIQNKIVKAEEKNDRFSSNTKKLFEMQLNHLAENQEVLKQEQEMQKQLKFAKGGLVKYYEGGPKTGSINPATQQPFTQQEIELYYQNPENENFGTEYIGAGNINNGVTARRFQPIPETNMRNNNAPQNNGIPFRDAQVEYENSLNQPAILPKNPSYSLQQPVGPDKPVIPNLNKINYTNPVKTNNINWNELGQISSGVIGNVIQNNRIDNMAKPRILNNVRVPSQGNPRYVNLSGQRNAISRVNNNAMDEAQRSFGNSASIQAFKNKARLNELQGLGESYQNQENMNSDIYNKDLAMRNEMFTKQQLTNAEIEKYNIDAIYGDAQSRVSAKNIGTAQLSNIAGQVFGNRTNYQNQLDQANILKNQYNPEVVNRMIENGELVYKNGKLEKKAMGGKVKRNLKKK